MCTTEGCLLLQHIGDTKKALGDLKGAVDSYGEARKARERAGLLATIEAVGTSAGAGGGHRRAFPW